MCWVLAILTFCRKRSRWEAWWKVARWSLLLGGLGSAPVSVHRGPERLRCGRLETYVLAVKHIGSNRGVLAVKRRHPGAWFFS